MRLLLLSIISSVFMMQGISHGYAGKVRLKSDNFDNICQVKLTVGPEAPNGTVEDIENVKKGWSRTGNGRICYRRSSDPDVCGKLTNWNCCINPGAGTTNCSIR